MRKINMKPAMSAYDRLTEAESRNRSYTSSPQYAARFPDWAEAARQAYEQAKVDLDDALEPITEAIKAAEGRATARTVTALQIVETLKSVERALGISKRAMDGVSVIADPHAQKLPSAYRYRAESTQYRAEFKRGTWYLTDVDRLALTQRDRSNVFITHTEASKAALLERLTAFRV